MLQIFFVFASDLKKVTKAELRRVYARTCCSVRDGDEQENIVVQYSFGAKVKLPPDKRCLLIEVTKELSQLTTSTRSLASERFQLVDPVESHTSAPVFTKSISIVTPPLEIKADGI